MAWGLWWRVEKQTGINNNSTSITGLTSESSYQYRSTPNSSGDGEESDSFTITTLDVTDNSAFNNKAQMVQNM